ncbi:phospholipase A2 inhibitor and Ly6/PLAUR domain-containing protein-like [Chelonia mydas]|uniref:phospholipase A2 inhibitor and Ly6/PLAUR domain-containing protein-like n=1 Tax=Chelonia mydas TaxID=8469 RepID=UPI001CAA166B|nr:phospholipase A2 inhibitor and Ly6/PLAUR domain-containing protein-like [Chelonia mydas]
MLPRCSAHCSKHPGTMWVALPLCLLSALLATGSALRCEVCASKEQSCSGPLQLCAPSEGTCVAVVAEIRLEGSSLSYTAKSCLEPKNCEPGPFSQTYAQNVTMRVNIACCDSDGCNAGAIPVPTVSSVPNGRQCLSIFKLDGIYWKPFGILACTGAEDHCVEESGQLKVGDVKLLKSAAGCGSRGACIKRLLMKKYAQGVMEWLIRSDCYPAPWAGGGIGEP